MIMKKAIAWQCIKIINKMEYFFSYPDKKSYSIIEEYILENSDTVEFTAIKAQLVRWLFISRTEGGKSDERFIKTLDGLKEDFIKTVVDNKKFGGIEQFQNDRYSHYYYKLSDKIKGIFKKQGLNENYSMGEFYGFEDPVFYKDGKMIANVVSHDSLFNLYINDKEKEELIKKGLEFKDYSSSCSDRECSCSNHNRWGINWACFSILLVIAVVVFFIIMGMMKWSETFSRIIFRR